MQVPASAPKCWEYRCAPSNLTQIWPFEALENDWFLWQCRSSTHCHLSHKLGVSFKVPPGRACHSPRLLEQARTASNLVSSWDDLGPGVPLLPPSESSGHRCAAHSRDWTQGFVYASEHSTKSYILLNSVWSKHDCAYLKSKQARGRGMRIECARQTWRKCEGVWWHVCVCVVTEAPCKSYHRLSWTRTYSTRQAGPLQGCLDVYRGVTVYTSAGKTGSMYKHFTFCLRSNVLGYLPVFE